MGETMPWYGLRVCAMFLWFFLFIKSCSSLACAAVSFTRYKHFVNPSRASPLDVNIQYTTYNNRRSSLYCNYKVAICLSPMLSNESHLLAPAPFGLKNKFISGYFHQQEWQRFKGFSCMVFDKPSMVAQIFNSSISFTTFGSLKGSF